MSRKETEKQKLMQEYCQRKLNKLLQDEDNKYCVDCDAKGPRWVSWNIGIFLCIRCAGIHRNLGVHISRVKSVNLDSWKPEQVVALEQMGNSRARAVYEANVPDNFRRPQTDSALETLIRAKYEQKKYIAKEWVPTPPPVKVDWEKEMEEELEKQKKKKKISGSGNTTSATIAIPAPSADKKAAPANKATAIPPPLSKSGFSSPKSNRIGERKSASSDLLGLTTGSSPAEVIKAVAPTDAFANFLSDGVTTNQPDTLSKDTPSAANNSTKLDGFSSLDKEEADFFNQTPASKEAAAKLTKDSILALYGSAPTIPAINPINNFAKGFNNGTTHQFGMPAGAFSNAPPSAFLPGQPAPQNVAFSNHFGVPGQQQWPPMGAAPQWANSTSTQPPTMAPAAQAFSFPAVVNPAIPGTAPVINPNDAIAKQFGSLNLNNVWQ